MAAILTRYPDSPTQGVAFRWSGNRIGETLALALRLQPDAQRIVVIDGVPTRPARDVGQEIRSQIDSIHPRQPVTFFDDLPLDELLPRVRALPPDTIILLTRQYIGHQGQPIAHADAIRELSEAAPAPIYVTTDEIIGSGAIGGVVVRIDDAATPARKTGASHRRNEIAEIPPAKDRILPMLDWRALRRWGIAESRLPQGSVVLHKQLSLWIDDKAHVVVAVVLFSDLVRIDAGPRSR